MELFDAFTVLRYSTTIAVILISFHLFPSLAAQSLRLTPLISNGVPTNDSRMEFVVLVKSLKGSCSGSMISNQYVLTAAHCQWDSDDRIAQILVGRTSSKAEEVGVVDKVSIHPMYSPLHGDIISMPNNDVAIVKLREPIQSASVIPVVLAMDKATEVTSEMATIAGFGRTVRYDPGTKSDRLRIGVNEVMATSDCEKKFFELLHNQQVANVTLSEYHKWTAKFGLDPSHLCSLETDSRQSIAPGDSGGPLFVLKGSERVQIGVASALVYSVGPRIPYIFASVANAYEFINAHSEGHRWYLPDGTISEPHISNRAASSSQAYRNKYQHLSLLACILVLVLR